MYQKCNSHFSNETQILFDFFPQVLYKFTGSVLRALTGETWLRRSDLKRAQFLYREKENKQKKKTPRRPARFICRVNGKP